MTALLIPDAWSLRADSIPQEPTMTPSAIKIDVKRGRNPRGVIEDIANVFTTDYGDLPCRHIQIRALGDPYGKRGPSKIAPIWSVIWNDAADDCHEERDLTYAQARDRARAIAVTVITALTDDEETTMDYQTDPIERDLMHDPDDAMIAYLAGKYAPEPADIATLVEARFALEDAMSILAPLARYDITNPGPTYRALARKEQR